MVRKCARRSGSVVTIHDVARHAGASPITVSRVIHSGPRHAKAQDKALIPVRGS